MKRWRITWLAMCGVAMLTAPALARDVVPLAIDADGVERVVATVDGHSGTFLFDSGIGTTAITPTFAVSIGCKPWGKVTGFRATGERLDLPRCNSANVMVGSSSVTLPQLTVIDLSRFMGQQAAGLSGAVGLDALQRSVVTLDVAHHQLVIEDAASLTRLRRSATRVPIRLVRQAEGAALTVDIAVPTTSGPAWMELDTGNYGPSLVDKTVAGLFGLDPTSAKPQELRALVQGTLVVSGSVIVKDLILDGNLGREVLRHWLVTLDFANGQGWIRTNDGPAT